MITNTVTCHVNAVVEQTTHWKYSVTLAKCLPEVLAKISHQNLQYRNLSVKNSF